MEISEEKFKELNDIALKYKELNDKHDALSKEHSELKGKYESAVATAQDLSNKVLSIVSPRKETEVEQQPKDLETIMKNKLGGNYRNGIK